MRHFGFESFPNHSLSSQNLPLQRTRGALHLRHPPFSIEATRPGAAPWTATKSPPNGAGAGDGKIKRVTITEKTQAGSMMGFFHSLPPGTKATAVPPPPGPKATVLTQSDYHNSPRAAYDITATVLVQMVPEIGEQAADSELSGRFRGVLTMVRGMVIGSRANASTNGASI